MLIRLENNYVIKTVSSYMQRIFLSLSYSVIKLSTTNFPEFISDKNKKFVLMIRYNDIKVQNALLLGINHHNRYRCVIKRPTNTLHCSIQKM